jgi:6-pyruvoyltetrahydropterin/6-carboxytetrahydropterin synthase
LHGYSLAFKFTFESEELDVRHWVVDFGSLKSLKSILEDNFDHTCLVAEDDPEIATFKDLHRKGIIKMVEVPATGCEETAKLVYETAETWLKDAGYAPRVKLRSVEVMEHGANSAIYEG